MSIFSAFFRTLFKQCFDYSSRTTRRWYYIYSGITLIFALILMASSRITLLKFLSEGLGALNILDYIKIILLCSILLSWPALVVRRLHDSNESGRLALTMLIPILNFKYFIAMCRAGTKGSNNFGKDPRETSWMQ